MFRYVKTIQTYFLSFKRKTSGYKFKNVHISGPTDHFRYTPDSAYSFGLSIGDIVAYASILTKLLCSTIEHVRTSKHCYKYLHASLIPTHIDHKLTRDIS